MNAVIKAFWQNPIGVNQVRDDPMVLVVPFGAMIPSPTGGGAVDSVNGKTGVVLLDATDVGADPAGTATAAIAAALAPYATQTAVAAGDASTLLSAQTYATNSTNALATTINGQLVNKADLVNGVLATSQIPAQALTEFLGEVTSQAEMLALVGQSGDWCIRSDVGMTYIITAAENTGQLSDWTALPQVASPVVSVNGQIGVIVLSYADVGAEQAGAVAALQAFLQPQIDTKADANAVIAALAAKVSTTEVVTSPAANKLLKLDSNSKLPADITGNAATATKLVTARTIALTGAVSGSASFDGSTNISITTTASSAITWANVSKIPANLQLGFADGSHVFQVGKDADGYVYVRGVIRNTGGSTISALIDTLVIPISPVSYKMRGAVSSNQTVLPSAGGYYLDRDSSTNINGAQFLSMRSSATQNWLGLAQLMAANSTLFFPVQCIGLLE